MRLLLIWLFAAAPLCAEPLIEHFWPDARSANEVSVQAEKDLLAWLKARTDKNEFPRTHFGKGEPCDIRDASPDAKRDQLTVRLLTREFDAAGNATYRPVGNDVLRGISEWPSRYALITFGPDNHADKAAVAFAVWLYLRKNQDKDATHAGNRALTVVHQRNSELRELIEAWVLTRDFKGKGELRVGEWWDDEFRVTRKLLITEEEQLKFNKARNDAAESEFRRIDSEFARERTLTLQQLLNALDAWARDFAATETLTKRRPEADKLRAAIEAAISKCLSISTQAGQSADDAREAEGKGRKDLSRAHWKSCAEKYEQAIAIDSASALLLSQVANAWLKAGDPEYFPTEDRWGCTHSDRISRAIPWWIKLNKHRPEDTTIMLNLGLCYQLTGKSGDASRVYNDVVRLEPDSNNAKEARRRLKQMQPKK